MELVLFLCFSAICIVSGAAVIFNRHPVKSAMYLIVSFFSMGGLYLLMQAEFIALMQVLVYAGAIMVLFLFVIMLLNLRPRDEEAVYVRSRGRLAVPLAVLMLIGLLVAILHPLARLGPKAGQTTEWVQAQGGNVKAIGKILFVDYLLPFEVTSILLLIAVIGVIVLAKRVIK